MKPVFLKTSFGEFKTTQTCYGAIEGLVKNSIATSLSISVSQPSLQTQFPFIFGDEHMRALTLES